ncbi:MAG TPA: RluA family pseudouridine synthase [Candidatus Limnocylindria bacterium]|nr:RluA family pseudouridine synthase [Candidatus Limnocylindria bacterium]
MSFPTPPVLFEDNHLLVALKPPRMLTQGDATGDADMLTLLKAYVKEKYGKPGEAFLGLVHRMDRPVGGILVFARTSKAAARLSQQIREDRLHREYVLVCRGDTPDRFTLKDYLVKDERENLVRVLPRYLKLQGKEALLYGQTVAHNDEKSLVAVRLGTGRAHQIRAQMAHFEHPLLGDARYNPHAPEGLIALWGMRLRMDHPITGKAMTFVCPPHNVPEGFPVSPHFAAYRRELDGLARVWPDIAQ